MANTKATGVAYADPEFESVSVTGNATVTGTMTVGGNTLSGAELGFVDGVTAGTAAASKAVVLGASKDIATITSATITTVTIDAERPGAAGQVLRSQANPTAKTVSATLTAAEIVAGIITVNQGGGANSALQLPLATAMDSAFPASVANDYFDFSLINISTVAAETASVTTNTGWTLVGNMLLSANTAVTANSQGWFRVRKTGTGAWSIYRTA